MGLIIRQQKTFRHKSLPALETSTAPSLSPPPTPQPPPHPIPTHSLTPKIRSLSVYRAFVVFIANQDQDDDKKKKRRKRRKRKKDMQSSRASYLTMCTPLLPRLTVYWHLCLKLRFFSELQRGATVRCGRGCSACPCFGDAGGLASSSLLLDSIPDVDFRKNASHVY